ncbi:MULTISPECIES: integration host factor, actinobacterial type [Allokutzneria]|nr:integration host factor, actinobacterial type [Allokutzneria sp. NRRL B-24872]
MPLPTMTPEQQAQALAKAQQARAARSALTKELKEGSLTLPQVLAKADSDDVVRKTKVLALVKALPGIGAVRAARALEAAGIPENRRVGGLGERQRASLLAELAD